MRKLSALLLVTAGFSQYGCGDSASGPGLGPDTTWQIGCAKNAESCSFSPDPHGPVQGADPDATNDDEKIKVTCSSSTAGLAITLEDPGRDTDPKNPTVLKGRAHSILTITNAKPDDNKCFVTLTEVARSGTTYRLAENCENSAVGETPANCQLTGTTDGENGYDFEGTLQCPSMHLNNTITPFGKLGAAKNPDNPIKLQIVHCS